MFQSMVQKKELPANNWDPFTEVKSSIQTFCEGYRARMRTCTRTHTIMQTRITLLHTGSR